ncbi:ferric reductase-like transmembrane domain-containing protein [Methanohalophilus halophilus]|uniref:Ferric reductase n=1 Tax=Methanohalophilus halophilus TaxID=2177 RepID=A0A1L3Q3K1_9EURY|nr:ferric reductase-like transmembrane domain-containing protein [Methanohalophilus halophilus]APH39462.1 ferric reductase [Methanohalophilus halophilus]RNI07752.1 ferric reductase [Methanohalophilus halophilus]SDW98754.1 Ferric reductase like transmembrane component [Methanohalophilus halophilus]
MEKRWQLIFLVTFIAAIIAYILLQAIDKPLEMIDRAAGLFAYYFIFLAILSSEYMKQMKKVFGQGFIRVHHHLARLGISLMLLHPIAFAFEKQSISIFIPVFYPLMEFLELAGRPAFYLIIIAVAAGVYRKHFIRKWKKIHYLNYPAFLLIFIHSWLIGTDLNSGIMQLLWVCMALVIAAIFVHKHIINPRKSM